MPKSVAEELHYETVYLPVTILLDRTGMQPWDTSPQTSSFPSGGWPLGVDLPLANPNDTPYQSLLRRTVTTIQVKFPWPAVGSPPFDGVISYADVSPFMQDASLVIHYAHPVFANGKWFNRIGFNDGPLTLYSTRQTPEPAGLGMLLVGLVGLRLRGVSRSRT
jgi:hypothetical protein